MKFLFIFITYFLISFPMSASETESRGGREYTLLAAFHPRTDRESRPPIGLYDGHLTGVALREAKPTIFKDWETFLAFVDEIPEGSTIHWNTGCWEGWEIFVADKIIRKGQLVEELNKRGISLRHRFGL